MIKNTYQSPLTTLIGTLPLLVYLILIDEADATVVTMLSTLAVGGALTPNIIGNGK